MVLKGGVNLKKIIKKTINIIMITLIIFGAVLPNFMWVEASDYSYEYYILDKNTCFEVEGYYPEDVVEVYRYKGGWRGEERSYGVGTKIWLDGVGICKILAEHRNDKGRYKFDVIDKRGDIYYGVGHPRVEGSAKKVKKHQSNTWSPEYNILEVKEPNPFFSIGTFLSFYEKRKYKNSDIVGYWHNGKIKLDEYRYVNDDAIIGEAENITNNLPVDYYRQLESQGWECVHDFISISSPRENHYYSFNLYNNISFGSGGRDAKKNVFDRGALHWYYYSGNTVDSDREWANFGNFGAYDTRMYEHLIINRYPKTILRYYIGGKSLQGTFSELYVPAGENVSVHQGHTGYSWTSSWLRVYRRDVSKKPTVQTTRVTQKEDTSALLVGNLIDPGIATAEEHGFIWSDNASQNLTVDLKTKVELGEKKTAGQFSYELKNLKKNTVYYIRSYAINNTTAGEQIVYGNTITFRLNEPPTVEITKPSEGYNVHVGDDIDIQWKASDPNGDDLTYKIFAGSTLGGKDLLNGVVPNGSYNKTSGQHTYKSNTAVNTWNPALGRYEKEIFIRVEADDGQPFNNKGSHDRKVLLFNNAPDGKITNFSPATIISLNNEFKIKGKAWDNHGDKLTISATIDGKTRTYNINDTPTEEPLNDNWELSWKDISEGEYKDIKITIKDQYGGIKETKWSGQISVKDILKDIDRKIEESSELRQGDLKFIAANTDIDIKESAINNQTINRIIAKIQNRESEMYFIGTVGTENYIKDKLTEHYAYSDSDKVADLIDFMDEQNKKLQKKETKIFLVGQTIDNDMLFKDLENDFDGIDIQDKLKGESISKEKRLPKFGTLQAKYEHNPSVFDSPEQIHEKSNNIWNHLVDMKDPFLISRAAKEMRGEWTITLKASDSTKNEKFDKYSDDTSTKFIIHEKPTAIMKIMQDNEFIFASGADSYDIDFKTLREDKGVIKHEWFYRFEGEGNWHKFGTEGRYVKIPRNISGKKVEGIYLKVTDVYGATDQTQDEIVIEPGLEGTLNPEEPIFDIFGVGIPASEKLKVTDIITIPYAMDQVEFSLYKNGIKAKDIKGIEVPTTIFKSPNDIMNIDVFINYWKDIRNYVIPETLQDGNYVAKLKATKPGLNLEKSWNIKVNTPITLTHDMANELEALTTTTITAKTNKYVNRVTIDPLSNGNVQNMTYAGMAGAEKLWKYNYTVPDKPEGTYTATFKATTPNGNEKIVKHNYLIYSLKLINFRITNIVNHKNYSYPISKENLPVLYKTGYNVTFRINSKGYPNSVKTVITTSPSVYNNTITLKKVGTSGNQEIWEGKFFVPVNAGGKLDNIKIYANTTAYKGSTTYNYNAKENWNGHILTISGRALQDVRINRTK